MAFFAANPFSTPVGQKIEQATSEHLPSEDWSLNLEICDFINSSEEFAKDAAKAIRKRFSQTPKNYKVVMYTLIVLETCVKNTGPMFHFIICSKDFVQDMVKLIGPKNDPPIAIQHKVLSLVQAWSDTFRHQSEYSGVCQVYADLRHKGIEFPPPEADATPIITPNASVPVKPRETPQPPPASMPRPPPIGGASPRHHTPSRAAAPPPQNGITPEIRSKLEKELGVVESNATVLSEMLSELSPGNEHTEDLNLLQELHMTCVAMQKRVVELVARMSDDVLTADLLRVNDLLNNLFIRYDRYMGKSKAKGSAGVTPDEETTDKIGAACAAAAPVGAEEVSLIDLNDDQSLPTPSLLPSPRVNTTVTPPTQQMAAIDLLGTTRKPDDLDDFDSFAQSRTTTLEGSTKPSDDAPAAISLEPAAASEPEVQTNFESMERWMSSQPYGAEVSSDAFQKFLAERASAAEKLPTVGEKGTGGD